MLHEKVSTRCSTAECMTKKPVELKRKALMIADAVRKFYPRITPIFASCGISSSPYLLARFFFLSSTISIHWTIQPRRGSTMSIPCFAACVHLVNSAGLKFSCVMCRNWSGLHFWLLISRRICVSHHPGLRLSILQFCFLLSPSSA